MSTGRSRCATLPLVATRTVALALAATLLAGACAPRPPRPAVEEWQGRAVDAGGVRLRAWSAGGNGPETLVLLSGGPGSAHDYLRELRRAAPEGMRVVAYDQRGTGLSKAPRGSTLRVADHVADLEAVRHALGSARLHLLGHSWGGTLALAYAAANPERVASLVLVGSLLPVAGPRERTVNRIRRKLVELLGERPIPDGCQEQLRMILPAYFHDPAFRVPAAVTDCAFSCEVRDQTSSDLQALDVGEGLRRVTAPALVIFGQSDLLGVETGRATVAALPASKARLAVLARCGHFPWLECPDGFYREVRPFLKGVSRR